MSYLGNRKIPHVLLVRGDKTTPADWQADTVYYVGEVVTYNGVYYVCIRVTQGYLDTPDMFPDEWKRLSGGSYKGEYSSEESYSQFDLVMCEGNLYEAKVDNPQSPPNQDMVSHWTQLTFYTSGESAIPDGYIKPSGSLNITENGTHDVTNYASVAVNVPSESGGSFKGEYDDSVAYKQGDIVVYQGNVYMCGSDMTEGGNNPVDNHIYWNGGTPLNTVVESDTYKGEYDSSVAYNKGDIVIYGSGVYRCVYTMPYSGYAPSDYIGMYWEQLDTISGGGGGGTFKGEAMSISDGTYVEGDIVTYNGDVYMFNSGTMNGQPLEYYDWTRLNTVSNGLVTLSGGTYYFRSSAPEYANRDNLADKFEITESINGSYSIQGYSGMFGTMTLIGKGGGSFDASAKFDETTIDSLRGSGSSDYVIINGDAQVSSAFYQAFMSAFYN